ncbi:MAG: hypothetical protein M3N07_01695 [Pseudomonadota bacterium]|nr:hypothetical protein [Pseudomonadota bacterium]
MALDKNISGLIGRIYESADDTARWEQVIVEILSILGAQAAVQTISDLNHCEMMRTTTFGNPLRPEGIKEYQEWVYSEDPSFQWAMEHPHARFCDTSEIMSAEDYLDHETIRWNRSEWIGSTHWLVGYTAPEDELTFGLSVHPAAEVGVLPEEKKNLFKLLFAHMERAVHLASRPPAFAGDGHPLVLLDRMGRVRAISPAAQDILERQDGLVVWDQQLRAADSRSSHRLNAAILSALTALREGGFGGAVALPRPSGKRDLLVTVTPLLNPPSPFEAFRPAALVRIIDPEAQVSSSAVHRWSSMFDFSPAEARLAEALMGGHQNLRHAADQLGVAYETARVHLKKLLEKTGTHSQSQLARLLSRIE